MDLNKLIEAAGTVRKGLEELEAKSGHEHSALAHAVAVTRCLAQAVDWRKEEQKLKDAAENPAPNMMVRAGLANSDAAPQAPKK